MADEKLTIWQRLSKGFGPNSLLGQEAPTMKFNKDILLKTQNKAEFEKEKLQAQQSMYLTNQWSKIEHNLYTQSVYYEPNRLSAYFDFEGMEFCIAGDTKIATPNGFITIKELADKGRDYEFITYAYDHNLKEVVPVYARNAHHTRDEMTYKIIFDDNSFIIATWEHQFMKRDGTFERVMNLKEGDSMMPFYTKSFYNNQNYNWIYTCNSEVGHHGWISEHNLIAEWYYKIKIKKDEEVHHKDFNGKNNLPENLLITGITEHRSYHAKIHNKKMWENPAYREKMKIIGRMKKGFSWKGRRSGKNNPAYFDIPFDNIIETARNIKSLKGTAKKLNVSHRKIQREIVNAGYKDWQTFLEAYGIEKSIYSTAKATGDKIKLNHKILSIEPFGIIPVYDLTVPGYKNFATDTIFSHNTPEISAALDTFAEESTTVDQNGKMLQIYSESKRIKSILTDLFYNQLDLNTNLPMWTRNTCKYGDNFVFLKLDPEKGIVGCFQLPNIEMERIEKGMTAHPNGTTMIGAEKKQLLFSWKNKQLEFNTWEIAHFRLLGDDRKLPYGTSILEKARRIWKQLCLAEDAMLIYRTSRAPERRVFKVFVGNMDDKDVEAYVQRFANKFKRDQVADSKTGNVDLRFNQMAVDQDYFVPVRDVTAPNPIDTLPGACIALDTKIPLLDGRTLTLSEIINEWDEGNRDLWVYSCDPKTGKSAPGIITWAGVTRKNTNVMRITLDNGKSIVTTPDHKFVHRTNGFVEAKDLIVGDSLMPFYTRTEKIRSNTNDYAQTWDNEKQEWIFDHRMVVNHLRHTKLIKEFVFDENKKNLKKSVIHHKDINRFNNLPSNLLMMNGGDHMRYHQHVIKKTIWANPEENKEKISKGLKKHINGLTEQEKLARFTKNINSPQSKAKTTKILLEWNKDTENLSSKGKKISAAKSTPEGREKCSNIATDLWKKDGFKERVFSKKQTLTFNEELFNMFVSVFETNLRADKTLVILNADAHFIGIFTDLNRDIRSSLTNLREFTLNHLEKMIKQRGFKNFSEWKRLEFQKRGYKNMVQWKYYLDKEQNVFYNHKIVSIEFLPELIDTGTITVDGRESFNNYHTFATESGVYIKNSNLAEIADIEYIQKKLLTALRIPKAFLGFEEVVADGKNLALQDIRFARTINRVQKSMLAELNKIAIIHLFLLGFEDELSNFTIGLANPSTQADLLKVDVWKEKMLLFKDTVTSIEGIAPASQSWAKKHILGFSDEEIKLDIQQQRIERAVAKELENTPNVITRTGIFDTLDSIYGKKADEKSAPAQEPTSDMTLPSPDEGGSSGAPPSESEPSMDELPPEGITPPPVVPEEIKKDKMSILLEGDGLLNKDEEIDLGKARKQLGEMKDKLDELLNS